MGTKGDRKQLIHLSHDSVLKEELEIRNES